MTTALRPAPRSGAAATATGPRPADAFVALGITGDLAKVMTFRSLYRLDRRGLQPLIDAPPPVHPYAPATWGPEAAYRLIAGDGRWYGPRVAS